MHPRAEEDAFLFTFINYFLRITKDQREKAAAFTRAIVTRPSVKSKSVASCSGYEIGFIPTSRARANRWGKVKAKVARRLRPGTSYRKCREFKHFSVRGFQMRKRGESIVFDAIGKQNTFL